ncbi:MAG: MmgE/PrpD family protein [Chloroflexi bacterium]|nr:MmgE/PrpD family protein [Chloroflexota bacterium]
MAQIAERTEVAEAFAENVAQVSYDDLPKETVEVTRRSILDLLGVAVAGSGIVPEVRALVELVKEAGGKEECTVLGFGGRLPALTAAFANGALAHSLDYDDVFDEYGAHPSATTVPAALVVAERAGGVSGKQLITAVALGNDMMSRMSRAIVFKRDWFITPVFGAFTATAVAGKVLGLDKDRLVDAFGIAFCQAAGTMEIVYGTDSNIRALYDSFVGRTGVLSALMAQRGISGVKASMEGKNGLFNVYFHGEYDPRILTDHLGKRFEGTDVSFKAWPCCRRSHPALTAIMGLMRKERIPVDNIKSITVETNAPSEALCTPREARQAPKTVLDAKFSIPYTVANAILKGRVALEDFTPEAIKDPRTVALARRVGSHLNPEYESIRGMTPGSVQLETKDGRVYSHYEEFPYGHPRNPISREDSIRKFLDCASQSAKPAKRDAIQKVVDMVDRLETLEDVGEIARLLG